MRRKQFPFTMVPNMWSDCLSEMQATGATYRVALYLLRQARWSRTVTLSNHCLNGSVSRNGKRAALMALRRKGLIAVEDRGRKSPIVTVRFTD